MTQLVLDFRSHHSLPLHRHLSAAHPQYSDFTVRQAKSLSLTGYVRNASDGSVTGEAQGPEEDLKTLLGQLKKGPSAARVESVEEKDIATKTGETGFGQH
jgi:acylphosphatase